MIIAHLTGLPFNPFSRPSLVIDSRSLNDSFQTLVEEIEEETENNDNQTLIYDSQELRNKLKMIINLETRYYNVNGKLVEITFEKSCDEIPGYNPSLDSRFIYEFDSTTGIATGKERYGDNGLTLSINWDQGKIINSDYFWTEDDLDYFEQKKLQ
jgi:hypothetical protein